MNGQQNLDKSAIRQKMGGIGEGHYYTVTGEPAYTIPTESGERQTTLADARRLGLVPSVSTIARVIASPGLEQWRMYQLLEAALSMKKGKKETMQEFSRRVIERGFEKQNEAKRQGTEVHAAIERWLVTNDVEEKYAGLIDRVHAACKDNIEGFDLLSGVSERCFATYGYGGRVDWHSTADNGVVVDFKTKDSIANPDKLVYREHLMQCAAYAIGLGFRLSSVRAFNVFIGVKDERIVVVPHSSESLVKAFDVFVAAFLLWRRMNDYHPPGSDVFDKKFL